MTSDTMERLAPGRVDIRETDLLEAGIVALESGAYEQCVGTLKHGHRMCAEGVLADVLTRAFPETYAWYGDLLTKTGDWSEGAALICDAWHMLHPRGVEIEQRAGVILGSDSIVGANDDKGCTFPEIAAALRQARSEIEAGDLT